MLKKNIPKSHCPVPLSFTATMVTTLAVMCSNHHSKIPSHP